MRNKVKNKAGWMNGKTCKKKGSKGKGVAIQQSIDQHDVTFK
jgi:hypothetical protein